MLRQVKCHLTTRKVQFQLNCNFNKIWGEMHLRMRFLVVLLTNWIFQHIKDEYTQCLKRFTTVLQASWVALVCNVMIRLVNPTKLAKAKGLMGLHLIWFCDDLVNSSVSSRWFSNCWLHNQRMFFDTKNLTPTMPNWLESRGSKQWVEPVDHQVMGWWFS